MRLEEDRQGVAAVGEAPLRSSGRLLPWLARSQAGSRAGGSRPGSGPPVSCTQQSSPQSFTALRGVSRRPKENQKNQINEDSSYIHLEKIALVPGVIKPPSFFAV